MKSKRKVRFLNLAVIDSQERFEFQESLIRCLNHGQLVMGEEITNLEKLLADYVGRGRCISVSSGTDALFLALKGIGIKPGDEVITSPLSWIATANAIKMAGGVPVFCDILDDLNIDSSSIENVISKKTKAILSVDYTGNMADYNAIKQITEKYGVKLVEDGSQSFGASFNSKKCGSYGEVAAISHNPMKIFGGLGEIGSVFTDDDDIANRIEIFRYNGMINKKYLKYPSLNFRADALNAAFLQVRFKRLSARLKKRQEIAKRYTSALNGICITPKQTNNSSRVFYTYTIQVQDRNGLAKYLLENGIETKVQHPLLMSEQEPYLNCRSYTPKATELVKKILCLPIYESITDEDVDYVIEKIISYLS